jgi:hypothetical protein
MQEELLLGSLRYYPAISWTAPGKSLTSQDSLPPGTGANLQKVTAVLVFIHTQFPRTCHLSSLLLRTWFMSLVNPASAVTQITFPPQFTNREYITFHFMFCLNVCSLPFAIPETQRSAISVLNIIICWTVLWFILRSSGRYFSKQAPKSAKSCPSALIYSQRTNTSCVKTSTWMQLRQLN